MEKKRDRHNTIVLQPQRHHGPQISEDIRTASQAAEKIRALGGVWADVSPEEIKIYRLHFRDGDTPEHRCPGPGVVLYALREEMLAYVKAFSGATKRVAIEVDLDDIYIGSRSTKPGAYGEHEFFSTYLGRWGWRNQKIVPADAIERLDRLTSLLRKLEEQHEKEPDNEKIYLELERRREAKKELETHLFG